MFFQVKIYGYFDLLFPYLFCKMAYEKIIEFVGPIHQRRCYFSKCVRICLISLGTHPFYPICIFHQNSKCSKSARSTDVAFLSLIQQSPDLVNFLVTLKEFTKSGQFTIFTVILLHNTNKVVTLKSLLNRESLLNQRLLNGETTKEKLVLVVTFSCNAFCVQVLKDFFAKNKWLNL